MPLNKEQLQAQIKRLLMTRINILVKHGFFGVLLMKTKLGLTSSCDTAYTDAKGIYFNPEFISNLLDDEIEFVMLHEIMHIVLKHCYRGIKADPNLFNIACDIVVNSNILYSLDKKSFQFYKNSSHPSEAMHLAPDGKEGYLYTAEQVYEMLNKNTAKKKKSQKILTIDNHSYWPLYGDDDQNTILDEEKDWDALIKSAAETYLSKREKDKRNHISLYPGNLPKSIALKINELNEPQVNWRIALQEFIQEEINDYSFCPPDSRYQDYDFFLPAFNEIEYKLQNIVFFIDVSGSISRKFLTTFFSEISGVVSQFKNFINCYIALFDVELKSLTEFSDMKDVEKIDLKGGGGTSLSQPLNKVFSILDDIRCFVVLTDGYLEFPKSDEFKFLPVLWLITESERNPEYGTTIHIKS